MQTSVQRKLLPEQESPSGATAIGHARNACAIAPARILHDREDGEQTDLAADDATGCAVVALPRFRSLLVPLDGSAFAEHALPFAMALAKSCGARIRVLHVHSPLDWASDPIQFQASIGPDFWRKHQQRVYLDGVLQRMAEHGFSRGTTTLRQGQSVAASISAEAHAGADLVVMASHRRGLLGRLWYGGIAASLLRQLSLPLVIVPGRKSPPDLTMPPHLERILIPLDGSASAEQALEPAFALGEALHAQCTLLRVITHTIDYSLWCGDARLRHTLAEKQHFEACDYLRQLSRRWGSRNHGVQRNVVLEEYSVVDAVLRHVEQKKYDLIALAVRNRKGIAGQFRRSVADRVLQGASGPVLFAPANDSGESH